VDPQALRHRRVVLHNPRTDCWRTWHAATVTPDPLVIAGEEFPPVLWRGVAVDDTAETLLGLIAEQHGLDDIEATRAARSGHRDGHDCGVCQLDLKRTAPTAEQLEDHAHWLRAACARLFDHDDVIGVSHWTPGEDTGLYLNLWFAMGVPNSWANRTSVTNLEWSVEHGWRYGRLLGGIATDWFRSQLSPTTWTAAEVASELHILASIRYPLGVAR
jgi:hypothetical protein